VPAPSEIKPGDTRGRHPRFAQENLARNLDLVHRIEAIAREKGCTVGQLALAWLLGQGTDIIAIPGTKRVDRLDENLGALALRLTPGDLRRIVEAVPPGAVAGTRYPEPLMRALQL